MPYKTPGVYINEVSTLPPSVAEVSTAIPAFIGYTEAGLTDTGLTDTGHPLVARISTMLEYQSIFGGPPSSSFTVTVDEGKDPAQITGVTRDTLPPDYLLYYSLSLYFKNGGGSCYIISVGGYDDDISKGDFVDAGLAALAQEDEPTLILFPDAVNLDNSNNYIDYHTVCQQALDQCNTLKDRFTIMDVPNGNSIDSFRDGIGTNYLQYGAAYYPYLQTSINYSYLDENVTVVGATFKWESSFGTDGITVRFVGPENSHPQVKIIEGLSPTFSVVGQVLTITTLSSATGKDIADAWRDWAIANDTFGFTIGVNGSGASAGTGTVSSYKSWQKTFPSNNPPSITVSAISASSPTVTITIDDSADPTFDTTTTPLTITTTSTRTGTEIAADWRDWLDAAAANDPKGYNITAAGSGTLIAQQTIQLTAVTGPTAVTPIPLDYQGDTDTSATLADIQTTQTALYNQIRTALGNQRVTLPPSPAIAGVYASVDRDRGVWKAPANVSLASVIGPTVKITDADQESLNVDVNGGKSINAIRTFTGKGTLVWGARTLLGNDNEWRYISVRRLFIMIEESVQKSTAFAVFEPNDSTTWLKVKAMIESYLYGLWQQGALAGPTPDAAYFVNVGLGKTMTTQDVLEGRMIVEIGIAAVRPAEFIILTFMQKLQEA